MGPDEKKVAAAMAALELYLEDEARCSPGAPALEGPSWPMPSMWAMSGRHAIMNQRVLVSARLWK